MIRKTTTRELGKQGQQKYCANPFLVASGDHDLDHPVVAVIAIRLCATLRWLSRIWAELYLLEGGHPFERDFGQVAFNPVRRPRDRHPGQPIRCQGGTKRVGHHLCVLIKHLPELRTNQSER